MLGSGTQSILSVTTSSSNLHGKLPEIQTSPTGLPFEDLLYFMLLLVPMTLVYFAILLLRKYMVRDPANWGSATSDILHQASMKYQIADHIPYEYLANYYELASVEEQHGAIQLR